MCKNIFNDVVYGGILSISQSELSYYPNKREFIELKKELQKEKANSIFDKQEMSKKIEIIL